MMPGFRPSRRRMLAGSASVLALSLGGCAALQQLNAPAPKLYTLTPKSTYPTDLPTVKWQLGVDRPISPAGLATTRIAALREPYIFDYYAGAQWIDEAPDMVQRLLIESFDNTGKIIGVGRESVALRSDYVLRVELREFQAEYTADKPDPVIAVRLNLKLVRMPQRHIVATTTVDRHIQAPDNKMTTIIGLFDQALGKVLRDAVVWTLTALAAQS